MKLFGGKGRRREKRTGIWKSFAERLKRSRRLRLGLILPLSVAAVVLLGYASLRLFVIKPPEPPPPDRPPPSTSGLHVVPDSGATTQPIEQADDLPLAEPLSWRDGVYTVLLVGTFDDYNTDTIMFCTLDTNRNTLDVMSVPRDTYVVSAGRKIKKINGAYGAGGAVEKGMALLSGEIAELLGFEPHRYAMVRMSGFKRLVDTIGKVDFFIPEDMYHYDAEYTIDLKKGQQRLDGDKALQLMRFRGYGAGNKAGVANDDYGRMQMQQRFLKAVIQQTLKLSNIPKIPEFVDILSKSVKPTNLDAGDMLWYLESLLKLDSESIRFHTLPTVPGTKDSYVYVLPDEALKLINETVNPYTTDIVPGMVSWAAP